MPASCLMCAKTLIASPSLVAAGFCALSSVLPLPQSVDTETSTAPVRSNGLNATFAVTIHCVAAEPLLTFLRVGVVDREREVAYETAVLGRLRRGFRVLQLRGSFGTRIELCYLLVKISFGTEPNLWPSARQVHMLVQSITPAFTCAAHPTVALPLLSRGSCAFSARRMRRSARRRKH